MKALCGRYKSKKGKPFTKETLKEHQRQCPACRAFLEDDFPNEIDLSLTDLIAGDDLSDGAYWALAHELGEF